MKEELDNWIKYLMLFDWVNFYMTIWKNILKLMNRSDILCGTISGPHKAIGAPGWALIKITFVAQVHKSVHVKGA